MVVGFIKSLFFKSDDSTPVLYVTGCDYHRQELSLKETDISYDLNNEVPKLYIKGEEVGIVSMTRHYVTRGSKLGTNTTTFVYVTKDNPGQKILSINNLGEVFHQ